MKKVAYLLAVLAFLLFSTGYAQTDKGSWLIGGTGKINIQDISGDNTIFNITLLPNAGYFVINNLAVGARTDLTFSSGDGFSGSGVGVGPFVRYYFNLNNPTLKPLATAGVSFFTSAFKPDVGEKTTNNSTDFFVGPGLAFFINEFIAIEGLLLFEQDKNKIDLGGIKVEDKQSDLSFNVGLQIYLR